ncbi:2-oxoacid:ferredoxin oxidoreductase subunit alpha [Vulcanisaeta distributa]|uniref:2-oxoacid oxidoreductase (ferredoxin) n=1 Tax=Vulcanisaeta distributa (strain DSM 14429 / JCM 11212 / NBRC 100878 / IC-017) TaxID=572478 RepID=E1QSX3_VULDI|nr:2-oxoacid:ferredoxin oxidoreductase subunit alpha [Vulcanisaeta distributa]ADN50840.1 2-oxoglutarate synthase [Vulcanisaeta distributa DSM 14429]
MNELRYVIGGPQGGGLETTSEILSWAFARSGYGIISDREYFSNIKGRHSYVHATVSATELPKHLTYPVDIVAAMDAETVFTHFNDLRDGGYLIYNSDDDSVNYASIPSMERELKDRLSEQFKELGLDGTVKSVIKYLQSNKKTRVVALSFKELLMEIQKREGIVPSQASRYISTILVGAVAAITDISEESLDYSLRRRFTREDVYRHNRVMAEIVIDLVKSQFGSELKLDPPKIGVKSILVASGNDAIAMAKVVAGVRFQAYYPITPAADESFTLEEYETLGGEGSIIVFQTEDELAAINAAIGAALTGVRSSVATSGPGFDLMVEGLGWAGHNEVPVVVTYYQRGGPSTGQPTRGGQSDLLSSVFASHGEYPRIVLASGDHEEAFYDAIDAFNYAETYQVPVIHLVDKFLANTIATIPMPNLDNVRITRGVLAPKGLKEYKRFDLSSPISPRAFLGEYVMWYTGDEHDEYGHINEDPVNRVRMMNKRMSKLDIIDREIPEERRYAYFGPERPDVLLVGWGFVKGTAVKAIEELNEEGVRVGYYHIRMFIPFPRNSLTKFANEVGAGNLVAVEHNYMAQAAKLVAMNTGVMINKSIVKYTGRPMYVHELVNAVKNVLRGSTREVVSYGA